MNEKPTTGALLIAAPFMEDTFFHRTVILLCEHDEIDENSSSTGFCLNKPMELSINDIVDDFPEFEATIYCGGPVRQRALFFLHNLGDLMPNSKFVAPGIWWGHDFELLKTLVATGLATPDRVRFFVGYSGWSEGQLKEELETQAWVIANSHPNYVFKESSSSLWQRTMEHKGNAYVVMADMPPKMNWN